MYTATDNKTRQRKYGSYRDRVVNPDDQVRFPGRRGRNGVEGPWGVLQHRQQPAQITVVVKFGRQQLFNLGSNGRRRL